VRMSAAELGWALEAGLRPGRLPWSLRQKV